MTLSYKIRSGGFIIQRLQRALRLNADGKFGPQTQAAVQQLGNHGKADPGEAGQEKFRAAGLDWPSDFERAMNLVTCFEGTSFGDCNRRDIDGAGLTLGIAGFTTKHGEIQELLAFLIAKDPRCLEILSGGNQCRLMDLLSRRARSQQWKAAFYGEDGCVDPAWFAAFHAWGQLPAMQKLQLRMAEDKFWKPAVAAAAAHGFTSLRAKAFFLDVAVQNGGWRKGHLVLVRRMLDWHGEDESKALAAAARAVAACAKEQWRNDVLARKMTLATGAGVVHGHHYNLIDYAL